MATSAGGDKTLLATLVEKIDCEFEFSQKWNSEKDHFKIGDVVLVLSTDTPRGHWPLGRITKTIIRSDDRVRVVNVQVGQKELVQYTGWSHTNAIVELINHRLTKEGRNDKRKYELKQKHVYKLCDKQPKIL